MQYKVIYTKSFNSHLRALQHQGHKKEVQAVRAAISEAGMNGEIQSVPRTRHGEDRIPNAEKYKVSESFRLVVQLVDGTAKTRAFLFAGSHDDTERWLDAHRNYKWVKNNTDGTLDFVQVTERVEQRAIPADRVDLDSPDSILDLPLLRVLSPDEWKRLDLPSEAAAIVTKITGSDYERDADGIMERLDQLAGWEKTTLVIDLLWHGHSGEWAELHRRISILGNDAAIVSASEAAPLMLAPENSESFITFDDTAELDNFFDHHSMADWMLFLHPEQKRLTERDFRGPARLRGVSGSGKTSVLVHRARYLAKKYRQPVLVVTLTESMRKLLDHLADDLCGVERQLVMTITMSALARQVVHEVHQHSPGFYSLVTPERQKQIIDDIAAHLRHHVDFARTPLHLMPSDAFADFLRDEIAYVRSRLRHDQLEQYLDAQLFRRRGRGMALNEVARRILLDGIRDYERLLAEGQWLDHEGIVAEALKALEEPSQDFNTARCVLCDEVQDLSQLEMALLGKLPTPDGLTLAEAENGLFLAGDGAQTIYKRGFVLRNSGIEVSSSRSFNLRKNYRNTFEILNAAFGLVAEYEFADVDEDDITKPSAPELASRHGAKPLIMRYPSTFEEAAGIAASIQSLLAMGHTPGQICVVGPSTRTREEVQRALNHLGIEHTDLRQDADYESDRVKVSTIESAKGHEFGTVFIMGLVEGVLPSAGITDDQIPREASRLYVAMTRAREGLTLTYSPNVGHPASRFLMAIQANCDEVRVRQGEPNRAIAGAS